MEENTKISNRQRKKKEAEVFNTTRDISDNLLYIGRCGYCTADEATGQGGVLAMYLKSKPENICNYYCMNCDHRGTIKDIDKKDSFFFPMVDIVGEVSRHYDADTFDKAYNKD